MEKEFADNLKKIVKVFDKLALNEIIEHLSYLSNYTEGNSSNFSSYFKSYIAPIIDTIENENLESAIEDSKYLLCQYEKKLHTTIKNYLKNNKIDYNLESISQECGMLGKYSEDDYIICNKDTIMTYSPFSKKFNTFAVNCIYTKPEKRKNGSCKKLLESLNFNASLYFDTYSKSLEKIVKDLGGYEEDILKEKPSIQLILNVKNKL